LAIISDSSTASHSGIAVWIVSSGRETVGITADAERPHRLHAHIAMTMLRRLLQQGRGVAAVDLRAKTKTARS
jgi:hypothetical protein